MRFKRALLVLPPIQELSLSYNGPICWPSFAAMGHFWNFYDRTNNDLDADRNTVDQGPRRTTTDKKEDRSVRKKIEAVFMSFSKEEEGSDDSDSDGEEGFESVEYDEDHSYPRSSKGWVQMERAYAAWAAPASVHLVHLRHAWEQEGYVPADSMDMNGTDRDVTLARTAKPYVWMKSGSDGGRNRAPFAHRDHYSEAFGLPHGSNVMCYDSI